LSQTDQDRSKALLDFLDTDEFNQACKDVGAEAHAVAMSTSNVDKFDQETQTRPMVPMPIRVYRELCTRLPDVHEWWVLGLSHPINHPEWDGRFIPGFTCPSDEDLVVSLQNNVKNVADSEWFKNGKHLTETHLEVVLANAMAGCTLVPDPNDQIDGQHVPDDYEYVQDLSQEELQQQALGKTETERSSPSQMELESSGDDDVVVDSIMYHPGPSTSRGYTRSVSTEMSRTGQPSPDQILQAEQHVGRMVNTSSWPAYIPVPNRTPTPPERRVILDNTSVRRVRFQDNCTGAIPKRHRGPNPEEKSMFGFLVRSSPLVTPKAPFCPDALKQRSYYAKGNCHKSVTKFCAD
jgi:hypothetical protein